MNKKLLKETIDAIAEIDNRPKWGVETWGTGTREMTPKERNAIRNPHDTEEYKNLIKQKKEIIQSMTIEDIKNLYVIPEINYYRRNSFVSAFLIEIAGEDNLIIYVRSEDFLQETEGEALNREYFESKKAILFIAESEEDRDKAKTMIRALPSGRIKDTLIARWPSAYGDVELE